MKHEIGQQVLEGEKMLVTIAWLMVISWMPRTSPTFQSRFGLSGWALWQATQAAPMITGAIRRTLIGQ